MPKITPFLWFETQAEEAAKFYCSVFKNSKLGKASRGPDGGVMVMPFELDGQPFIALNGGPQFRFTEAVSFVIDCKDQKDVDYYWGKLTAGGQESQCGWLKDKYGLSWQVVPTELSALLSDPDPVKANRAMQAMLKMKKIVIADLKKP